MPSATEPPIEALLDELARVPAEDRGRRAVLAYIAARWYHSQGQNAAAERTAQSALQALPDLRPAMRLVQRTATQANDLRAALQALDQQIRATRHPREAAALYRERAFFVQRNFGDLQATLQCHLAAHKANNVDMIVMRALARAKIEHGDGAGFIEVAWRIVENLESSPSRAGYLHAIGLAELRRSSFLDAVAELEQALDLAPESALVAHDLRRAATHAGDLRGVVKALHVDFRQREPSEQAHALWAAMAGFVCAGRLDLAATLAPLALECEPVPYGLLRLTENLGRRSGDLATVARAATRQAERIKPEASALRADAWARAGAALAKSGMLDLSIAVLGQAMEVDPSHSEARSLLRTAAHAATRPEAYAQAIAKSLDRPTHDQASREARLDLVLDAAGLLLDTDRQLPLALELVETVLSQDWAGQPGHEDLREVLAQLADRGIATASDAVLRRDRLQAVLGQSDGLRIAALGLLAERGNEPEAAILAGERLLEFPAFRPRALAHLGRLYALGGRLHDALRVTQAELEETKTLTRKTKLAQRAGELALAIHEPLRARSHFEQALALTPNYWAARLALTQLARRQGDRELVIACLEKEMVALALDDPAYARVEQERIELLTDTPGGYEAAFALLREPLPSADSALRLGQHRWLALRSGQPELAPRQAKSRMLAMQHLLGEPLAQDDVVRLALRLNNPANDGDARQRAWRLVLMIAAKHAWGRALVPGLLARGSLESMRQAWPHLQRLPSDELSAGAAIALADAAWRLGRSHERLAWLSVARERHAHDGASMLDETYGYLLGDAALAVGDFALARQHFERASKQPKSQALAQRGLLRLQQAQRLQEALPNLCDNIVHHLAANDDPSNRGQWALAATELALECGDLPTAHAMCQRALAEDPAFLPAKWMRVVILLRLRHAAADQELVGSDATTLSQALEELVAAINEPTIKAAMLYRLALTQAEQSDVALARRGAATMQRAFCMAPHQPQALRWLAEHATLVAQSPDSEVGPALLRRIGEAGYFEQPDASSDLQMVLEVASLTASGEVLRMLALRALASAGENVLALVTLAQAHARQGEWTACASSLSRALARETAPHLCARLSLHLAHAKLQEGIFNDALVHARTANRLGENPDAVREVAGEVLRRSEEFAVQLDALEIIASVRPRGQRSVVLRRMADLCQRRDHHAQAISHLQAALRDSPFDSASLEALCLAHRHMGREEHAVAALRGRLAHARSALSNTLARGFSSSDPELLRIGVMCQRVFELLEDPDGHYLATAVLEAWMPQALTGNSCDEIRSEPWPLPSGKIDLVHELESVRRGAGAVQVLRELSACIGPIAPYQPPELARARVIPTDRDAVQVVQTLARVLGLKAPAVYADPEADDGVVAAFRGQPLLLLSRRVLASPSAARSREALARGLFRLACGGEGFFAGFSPIERAAVVAAACDALVDDAPVDHDRKAIDWTTFEEVRQSIARHPNPTESAREHLALLNLDARVIIEALPQLDRHLAQLEDRVALVCAGDPRPALGRVLRTVPDASERMGHVANFVLSDVHIALRQRLGYHVDLELDVQDLEEVPA